MKVEGVVYAAPWTWSLVFVYILTVDACWCRHRVYALMQLQILWWRAFLSFGLRPDGVGDFAVGPHATICLFLEVVFVALHVYGDLKRQKQQSTSFGFNNSSRGSKRCFEMLASQGGSCIGAKNLHRDNRRLGL